MRSTRTWDFFKFLRFGRGGREAKNVLVWPRTCVNTNRNESYTLAQHKAYYCCDDGVGDHRKDDGEEDVVSHVHFSFDAEAVMCASAPEFLAQS